MIQGRPYFAMGEELTADRVRSKGLCREYNGLAPADTSGKIAVIGRLFGRVGRGCVIEQPFRCDYGYNIAAGDNLFVNYNCTILDCAKVTIGDNVLIGPDCGFYTACHPLDAAQRREGVEFARPITVGSDVWIGGGVRVMPGVTIGEGSVIGGGSVVTHDIPAGVVAAGNPCRVIRKITENDKVTE